MDPQISPSLRRMKRFCLSNLRDNIPVPVAATEQRKLRRLLRIDFKDPNDDYAFVQELRPNEGTLVCHRKSHLRPAIIRKSFSPTPLQMLESLAQIQHPNIADILDMYFYKSQLCIISEYLDVSLHDLGFNRLAPEEWEIATIVAEIIKAMIYLLDTIPTCELRIDSIRLSFLGDIKLVPNMHYQSPQEEHIIDHQCNSAFLFGILEILMSHGTSHDKGWSQEALEFSSILSPDSLIPSVNHIFLSNAVSSTRLVPRIRLATQILGSKSRMCLDEHIYPSPEPRSVSIASNDIPSGI